ncbi:MAG: YihA family ribosome biogenesis GTP-binding protein, partial [Stutzerimonas stutzeri]
AQLVLASWLGLLDDSEQDQAPEA